MLNLQALEQAFSSVSQVGRGTIDCDVGGKTITLEALLPHEEVAVQKYAAVALEENRETLSANTEYLDRFQVALLAHAVAKVDGISVKDEDHVETGEVLPNGVRVKIPRVDAVRGLVTKWSRPVRTFLFGKYSELMERIDLESEGLIKYSPFDLDAEIKRTEARLEDLKKRKTERDTEQEAKHPFRQQVASFSKATQPDTTPVIETPPAPQPVAVPPAPQMQPQATPPTAPRKPIIPSAPPPPVPAYQPQSMQSQQPQTQATADEVLDDIKDAQQGMDLDDLQAQVAAENERLMRARQAQQQAAPQQPILRRPPPHVTARMDAEEVDDNTSVQKVGDVGGMDAYRIGQVPTLTDKMPLRNAQGAVVNQNSDKGTQNPRFRRG